MSSTSQLTDFSGAVKSMDTLSVENGELKHRRCSNCRTSFMQWRQRKKNVCLLMLQHKGWSNRKEQVVNLLPFGHVPHKYVFGWTFSYDFTARAYSSERR